MNAKAGDLEQATKLINAKKEAKSLCEKIAIAVAKLRNLVSECNTMAAPPQKKIDMKEATETNNTGIQLVLKARVSLKQAAAMVSKRSSFFK